MTEEENTDRVSEGLLRYLYWALNESTGTPWLELDYEQRKTAMRWSDQEWRNPND